MSNISLGPFQLLLYLYIRLHHISICSGGKLPTPLTGLFSLLRWISCILVSWALITTQDIILPSVSDILQRTPGNTHLAITHILTLTCNKLFTHKFDKVFVNTFKYICHKLCDTFLIIKKNQSRTQPFLIACSACAATLVAN